MEYVWWAQLTNPHRAIVCGVQTLLLEDDADRVVLYPQGIQLGHPLPSGPEWLWVPTMAVHPSLPS